MGNREKGFELLRILSMLSVVVAHFLGWGTTKHNVGNIVISFIGGGANSWVFPFAASFGAIGVICFVMISSYFICEIKVLRFDRIFKVWIQTFFYSVILAFLSSLIIPISEKKLLLSFVPIGSDQYWFVTKYIALMILAPILSVVVRAVSHKGMVIVLCALAFITVTITCGIPYGNTFFADSPLSVASFVFIFFIAAYFKKFGVHPWLEAHCGLVFWGGIIFQGIGGLALNLVHNNMGEVIYGGFSTGYNALSLVPATALFLYFRKLKLRDNWLSRTIVGLAPYTFAVYLIHDNPYFRHILWDRIFSPANYWQSPMWLVLLVVVPILILLACCLVDVFRSLFFKLIKVDKLVDKIKNLNLVIE